MWVKGLDICKFVSNIKQNMGSWRFIFYFCGNVKTYKEAVMVMNKSGHEDMKSLIE